MTRKEPTPIRKPLVPVPANEPQPLTFPKPALTDEQLRNYVATLVAQAMDERDERVVRALYKVVMDWPIAEIMTMSEEQFIALFRSVLEDA